MKKKEFEFLIWQGEGLKLEFKENFDAKNISREMVAFANTYFIQPREFGKKSISRNPLLFSLLKSVELAVKIGSGIERMRKTMKEAGLPETEFEIANFFIIKFKRPFLVLKEQKTIQKTVEKILHILRQNQTVTIKELQEITGLTRRGAEWNLAKINQEGKIKRISSDKGGHWEVEER